MLAVMAKQHESVQAKETVQARIDAKAVERLDELAKKTGFSRSKLVDYASRDWSNLTVEEIHRRVARIESKK